MISMKIVLGRMDDSLSCNRKVDEGFAEHLPLTGRCSMDHNHRNDGYGTEHLYVAIVQILSTDSVKPSASTTGLFNRLTEYNITASCHQLKNLTNNS